MNSYNFDAISRAFQESAKRLGDYGPQPSAEVCHGCGKPTKGGIVTPCSYCHEWGLFCLSCTIPFNEDSCSLTLTRCLVTEQSDQQRDYFSASQLETYKDCPRKWAWKYINGLDDPPNPYAAFGLRLHKQIENYLKNGIPFDLTTDEGEAAMAGLHLLPRPGTLGMTIEGGFELTGWGHKFIGYKDIEILDPGQIPYVYDHKSTGNFKWAKTEDELRKNIQAVLYATDAMIKTGSGACNLTWIYYKRTKPYRSHPVTVCVSRDDITETLTEIKTLADEMAMIKNSGLRALDLPPNPEACGFYGGCPRVKNCNLSPQEKLIGIMTQASLEDRKNAFLAGIRNNQQQGGQGAATAINPPQLPPQFIQAQAPPQYQTPPPQPVPVQAPPQGPPPFIQAPQVPQAPVVDEQVLIQARGVHPNWQPGTPWWNGTVYVNPGDPMYPPIYLQGSVPAAPMPTPVQGEQPAAPRRGRPRKNPQTGQTDPDDPVALASEGLSRISEGFVFLKNALLKGLLD